MQGIARAILAGLLGALGCGPKATPVGPGVEPEAAVISQPRVSPNPPAQEVLIGEMCPEEAAGRPAVLPLFSRGISWSAATDEVTGPLERHAARQFSVLRWDGSRAGLFSVAGLSEVGGRKVAVGAYAGGAPCAGGEEEPPDPNCVAAQNQCALAFSLIEAGGGYQSRPFEEDPDPAALPIAGGCVVDDKLLVDIDGDGTAEAYPVDSFLDPVRAPADEVGAVPRGEAKCTPRFAVRYVIGPGDPKHWRGLDLLGVIDIDGDGRHELVLSYHYENRRTWAIYTATSSVGRLDLIGEAIPWPRP